MKVNISVSELSRLPDPQGPHDLAWSYILDTIFADAFHEGIGKLDIILPKAGLIAEANLRAELSSNSRHASAQAVALLGSNKRVPETADRVYLLKFGYIAHPALLTLTRPKLSDWAQIQCFCYYTVKARLWGLPIRAAYGFGRPDLADRAMFAMRNTFISNETLWCYYRLQIWSRK